MPGFDHRPAGPDAHDNVATATRNARLGMLLFVVYLLLYGAFVVMSAFTPTLLDGIPWAGINLAILYGFGLIGAALLLALVYGWLCRAPAARQDVEEPQ